MLFGIDRVDFIKPVGQIGRVAHVVDRLPHGPVRRHRDVFGLHAAAGGVFRIQQAALQRVALGRRQLFQDLFLVLFVEAFEQFDSVVGFQFANAFGNRLRLEFLKDFLADGVIDLVQRREVEIRAGQFNQVDAVGGLKRTDQVAEIGLVQFRDDFAQPRRFGGPDGARHLFDKLLADLAVFIPHLEMIEHGAGARFGGLGHVDILGHAAPRRFDRRRELV